MASATSTESARRRRVITVFLVQGLAGLLAMVYVAYVRRAQTMAILHALGSDAPIIIGFFVIFATAVAFLKFELTNQIYVPVLTSWLAVAVAIVSRVLALKQFGPVKTDTRDPFTEYVKALVGQFPTYGV